MTVVVSVLTVVPGRATRLQGGVQLILLAAFLLLVISPSLVVAANAVACGGSHREWTRRGGVCRRVPGGRVAADLDPVDDVEVGVAQQRFHSGGCRTAGITSSRRSCCGRATVLTKVPAAPLCRPAPKTVTSWPRSASLSTSAAHIASTPPYPSGGSSYQGGTTVAIR